MKRESEGTIFKWNGPEEYSKNNIDTIPSESYYHPSFSEWLLRHTSVRVAGTNKSS